MCDELARIEAEKALSGHILPEKIVFDCIDYPPQSKKENDAPFIDEIDSFGFRSIYPAHLRIGKT